MDWLEKPLLTGFIVALLGFALLNLIPNLDPGYFEDGILTIGEIIKVIGTLLLAIGSGFVRFILQKRKTSALR